MSWLAIIAIAVGVFLAAFAVWLVVGIRRIDALTKLYADRRTLHGALQLAGGARRPPPVDLTRAYPAVEAANLSALFDSLIQHFLLGVVSPKGNVTDEFTARLTALTEAEAQSAKPAFLDDAARFFHAMLSDAEIEQFVADPQRWMKRTSFKDGLNRLLKFTTAPCVGTAFGRLRAELGQS